MKLLYIYSYDMRYYRLIIRKNSFLDYHVDLYFTIVIPNRLLEKPVLWHPNVIWKTI